MKLLHNRKSDFIIGGKKIFDNDNVVKLISIPLLGILLPNISGIVTNEVYPPHLLLICYLSFILLAAAIWFGNVKLMILLKKSLKLSREVYYKKLIILLGSVIAYTLTITKLALLLWFAVSRESSAESITAALFVTTTAAVLITTLYENFFLNQEHQDTLTSIQQLNVEKTHAELVALKNQIDPHFIFNSLNTLSYLIATNPKDAKLYNDALARVYHYILLNREKNYVQLMEEIEFMSNYFFLLKIRFEKAINMIIEINDTESSDLLILPISLQILLENVMKHNELKQEKPLTINVTVSANSVVVKNEINPKTYAAPTPKVGLYNLDNRYKLLTGKNISVQQISDAFVVKLPLINLNN